MSKIREAREAIQMWADDVYDRTSYNLLDDHCQTILTALNALERMQGVDLAGLEDAIKHCAHCCDVTSHPATKEFEDVINAAQTLVAIKKEVKG